MEKKRWKNKDESTTKIVLIYPLFEGEKVIEGASVVKNSTIMAVNSLQAHRDKGCMDACGPMRSCLVPQ